jgi:hypothetical protein
MIRRLAPLALVTMLVTPAVAQQQDRWVEWGSEGGRSWQFVKRHPVETACQFSARARVRTELERQLAFERDRAEKSRELERAAAAKYNRPPSEYKTLFSYRLSDDGLTVIMTITGPKITTEVPSYSAVCLPAGVNPQ